jgi:hypothetical protein
MKHDIDSSFLPKAHNERGESDTGIRHENIPIFVSLKSDLDSKTTAAQNEQKPEELIKKTYGSSLEDNSNTKDSDSNPNSDKSMSTNLANMSSEMKDEVKPLNTEGNTEKEQILSTKGHLLKDKNEVEGEAKSSSQGSDVEAGLSSGRAILDTSTRGLTSPFENPILTYLIKQQLAERDSNNSDTAPIRREASATDIFKTNVPQNIKREIFHQQTIINPNPYIHQLLNQHQMQKANPAYYQMQYPISQQQQYSPFPNTQSLTYTPHSDFPGNMPNKGGLYQEHDNQNKIDSVRVGVPQFPRNPESGGNVVTTLTLYPAIASVMYTTPTTGSTSASSAPPPSNIYQPQSSPPYVQSLPQQPFRGVPSLVELPKTRLIHNELQYASRLDWPLAGYFPIVIKDPFFSMYNMLTNMIEYGPEADVCKKTKSFRQGRSKSLSAKDESITGSGEEMSGKIFIMENGELKEISMNGNPLQNGRKMSEEVSTEDKEEERGNKDENQNTEVIMETGGKGNGGPFITRLMVRKGGVSIAGPGGIATASSGGTAIVGPGGVAYTSPNGLAVVGPGGKVVGLPSGADLSVLTSQIAASDTNNGSTPRFLNIPPGGKVVATGPVVYFHPPE